MSHIFLSYAAEDRDRVRPLVDLLGDVATVWWDQSIRPGENWEDAVERAVAEAACVVVVWTSDSVKSGWVKSEAGDARDRGILVPVQLDEVALPLAFRHIETAQLQRWDGDASHPEARALRSAVADRVARAPVPPSPTPEARGDALPAPRRVRRRLTPAVLAAAAVLALVLGMGGYAAYRQRQHAQPASTLARADSAMAADARTRGNAEAAADTTRSGLPTAPLRVEGIIISETETPTLASAQRALFGQPRGYHYMVDVDGTVASHFDETRRAAHTRGQNGTTVGIGMIHVSESGSRQVNMAATPYTRAQIDGLVALLTTLAHDHHLNVQSIRSKEEVDPKYPREITVRMGEIRGRVATLLAEWRLNGERPAAARVRTAGSASPP